MRACETLHLSMLSGSLITFLLTCLFHRRGDQAHLAPIFGLFHRAWLLEFENSLLSIDEGIESLPYWDFMKENLTLGEPPPSDSAFSVTYFGAYVGQLPDYVITDGSFAYWVETNKISLKDGASGMFSATLDTRCP